MNCPDLLIATASRSGFTAQLPLCHVYVYFFQFLFLLLSSGWEERSRNWEVFGGGEKRHLLLLFNKKKADFFGIRPKEYRSASISKRFHPKWEHSLLCPTPTSLHTAVESPVAGDGVGSALSRQIAQVLASAVGTFCCGVPGLRGGPRMGKTTALSPLTSHLESRQWQEVSFFRVCSVHRLLIGYSSLTKNDEKSYGSFCHGGRQKMSDEMVI